MTYTLNISSFDEDFAEEQMFKIFDKSGDGFISTDEMKKLMSVFVDDVSEAEINEAIKEADKDGDGKVNFEEFKEVMK